MQVSLARITGKTKEEQETIDNRISHLLLNRTLGEIVMYATTAANVKTNAICTLIFNAIFGTKQNLVRGAKGKQSICKPDINLINSIIKRVDGAIPEEDERDKYANIVGEALEVVMEGTSLTISFNDTGIIALAKAILQVAMKEDINMSQQQLKERQVATDIWLSRTGGRKSKPAVASTKVLYEDRDFATPKLGD